MSFPSSKNENWRYFNLRSLKEKLDNIESVKKSHLVFENQNLDTHLLINNDSIYVNKKLPKGISINIINATEIDLLDEEIKNKIGKIAKVDDYFISENTEKFNQLIIVNISKDSDLENILNLDINISKNVELKPRFLFYSNKGTKSSIQINFDNNNAIINSVFEFYLDNKSEINLVNIGDSKDSIEILNYWFEFFNCVHCT